MNKQVFGYLRVSGKGQLEGDGFERQRAAINLFCQARGWEVLRWFMDGAVSGETETEDREGFADMIGLCGPGTTMTIVVEDTMRLARSLIVSELACEEARKRNIEIFAATSGQCVTDDSTPDRVMIRQIFGVLAQWNKNVTISRLSAARRRKRLDTGRCEGPKPFSEDHVIEAIVNMREGGWSIRQITTELRRRAYPSPRGSVWWSTGTVHRILERLDNESKFKPRDPEPERKFAGTLIEDLVR